ncbi:MAG TPA: hypothetical protein VFT34_01830, partial [Verrucomicrobiae bacterium]|nr:hypothetical protein [Verrucomicrobiae bacterium]
MSERTEREKLAGLLARVRRRLFFRTACHWLMRALLVALPAAAIFVASDQRWNQGRASVFFSLAAVCGGVVFALVLGLRGLGERVRSALTFDEQARLKDRVSSAWEFLELRNLSEAHQVQIRDAIGHAERLDCRKVLG